jgi:hypothetical protein
MKKNLAVVGAGYVIWHSASVYVQIKALRYALPVEWFLRVSREAHWQGLASGEVLASHGGGPVPARLFADDRRGEPLTYSRDVEGRHSAALLLGFIGGAREQVFLMPPSVRDRVQARSMPREDRIP